MIGISLIAFAFPISAFHIPPTGDVPTQRFPDKTKSKVIRGNPGYPAERTPNQISGNLFVMMKAVMPKDPVVTVVVADGTSHQVEVTQHLLHETSAGFWNVQKNRTVFK